MLDTASRQWISYFDKEEAMGKPKGVALSHANMLDTAAATADAIGLTRDDIVFGVTTVFHVFGLGPGILGTMAAGGALVLQEQFGPAEALELIERHRVTVHHGVPTVFITEMREAERLSVEEQVRLLLRDFEYQQRAGVSALQTL
jgi:acyl-CoA synthetase (AMP-forming)/AMP-acid ligase II